MASTRLSFASRDAHRAFLATQAALPAGFRVGTTRFSFQPAEAPKPANMALTILALDKPTSDFAAVFTRNAFPGAPVLVGRRRLDQPTIGAVVVNNKISNVCAPGGVEAAEVVCAATAAHLRLDPQQVLPSSTGVIGWRLPVDAMVAALPGAVAALAPDSALPAAEGIMTTDLYPKVRGTTLGKGRIVGIAKGAGMIEPNMATMLVYLLTDLVVPREALRSMLARVVDQTFNRISVDSDTSTSDTVVALSSGVHPCPSLDAFENALHQICADLAEDVIRNGEGVHHVMRVVVRGCPDVSIAHYLGKAIVNSPLVKSAVCGNDPNVGRLVAAMGKFLGKHAPSIDVSRTKIQLGGMTVFEQGTFRLDNTAEATLVRHLKDAQLYTSRPGPDGAFAPPIQFPPHERCVEIEVDLGAGTAEATVLGADLSHEYISENADYRS